MMNFWDFAKALVDKLPGWPSEKQLVMFTTFTMGFMMLIMAKRDAALWDVELFKTLITVVIVTGCVNMILAFYFTANKSDEKRIENTGKAFDAVTAVASSSHTANDPNIIREGDAVTMEKNNGN